MAGYFLNLTDAKGNDEKIGGHLIEKKPMDINNMAVHFSSPCESVHESDGVSWTDATSDPRADAVSSETMEANRPQVFDTRCGENSSTSFLRLFLTGSTTITSIFSNTSRKLVMPIRFSSVYGEDIARSLFLSRWAKKARSAIMRRRCAELTWLSFSMWATSRGKRWARAESFSVLTCLTSERSSTSPSYAMGRMDVSLTEVLQRADITAARRRLLDVRKLASAISWK